VKKGTKSDKVYRVLFPASMVLAALSPWIGGFIAWTMI